MSKCVCIFTTNDDIRTDKMHNDFSRTLFLVCIETLPLICWLILYAIHDFVIHSNVVIITTMQVFWHAVALEYQLRIYWTDRLPSWMNRAYAFYYNVTFWCCYNKSLRFNMKAIYVHCTWTRLHWVCTIWPLNTHINRSFNSVQVF